MKVYARIWLACLTWMLALPAWPDGGRNLQVGHSPTAETEVRVALIIGNADYQGMPLRNPGRDARAIAARLESLGFEVMLLTDASQKEMNRAITRFGGRISHGAVGLFYFAGHGMQLKGKNFLIPIDAQIDGETAVRSESVDLDLVLEQMAATRIGIVILDACRNNPFERRFRSGTGNGLAQVDAPKGVLVAYATSPGRVAADGEGEHGLYTEELLHALDAPERRIEDVFKQVRSRVAAATDDSQIPWESSSLTGDFYFREVPRARNDASGSPVDPQFVELEMWQSVKDSDNVEEIQEYLKQYPQGRFAGLARARIDRMRPLQESDLAGKWDFGRVTGVLFAPAGHLCDVELLLTRGAFGNQIRSCHSNESFWRLRADRLEFLGRDGALTTAFTLKEPRRWEGTYVGPWSSLFPGVVLYLRREAP